jgi:hypothetical protein
MLKLVAILLLTLGTAWAQLTHSAILTWTPAPGQAGQTFNVMRAMGPCSGTPNYSTVATAITENTYTDTTVTPGNYCYVVTATFNGVTSPPSNTAGAFVPSFPPLELSVTVK